MLKVEERILELKKEGYQGNYITKLLPEGFDYFEIYYAIKRLRIKEQI